MPQPALEGLLWTEVADRLEALISRMSPESQGAWEWGATKAQTDSMHVDDFYETLRETREHFGIRGDTEIQGVFVEGSDLKLAITGNSPTAAARAEYLAAVSPKNINALIAYIREKEGSNGK